MQPPTRLARFLDKFFALVIGHRWWVLGFYIAATIPLGYYASRVKQDNSIDRLIVKDDPDAIEAQKFAAVFGEGEYAVLLAEAPDPYTPEVLAAVHELEIELAALPHVTVNSPLQIFGTGKKPYAPGPEWAAEFRTFATGTQLFRKQGLIGDHHIAIALILSIKGTDQRAEAVANLDQAMKGREQNLPPLTALRKVGEPYINAYLDRDTRQAGERYFPVFLLFVLVLNYLLYRSWRALVAFLATLLVSAVFTLGFVGATGGVFTIVSSLVPMTVLITCMATLVYLHSRFVEKPPEAEIWEHQRYALVNKFIACTASLFATIVGFAALVVSKIRPIREMGVWVAVGLLFTWIIVFTLFPALQRILRTPTLAHEAKTWQWYTRLVDRLPGFSYRYRYPLVIGSLVACVMGTIALFGFPGYLEPMSLKTHALEYINHDTPLYRDTEMFEQKISGLSLTEIWMQSDKPGVVTDAEVLSGINAFADAISKDDKVRSVVGLPMLVRTMRYMTGHGDSFPTGEDELEQLSAQIETLARREPSLSRFIDTHTFSQTHLGVITPTVSYESFLKLQTMINTRWKEATASHPALAAFTIKCVGIAPLQAKISHHLVPTLVESFGITAAIIFVTFLFVFRSGAARLMAMIPSLFAILVMFLFMRVFGMSLNVATILIASTVLGTSENDQIHFFFHYLEPPEGTSTEDRLRHAFLISGRAIFFATLINAGGFLAFALSDLPPMRQFAILASLAFILSMLADFTALPASLWLVFRERLKSDAKPKP